MSDLYLIHSTKGSTKPGHKYISRKKGKNGRWQYTYERPHNMFERERNNARRRDQNRREQMHNYDPNKPEAYKDYADDLKDMSRQTMAMVFLGVNDDRINEYRQSLNRFMRKHPNSPVAQYLMSEVNVRDIDTHMSRSDVLDFNTGLLGNSLKWNHDRNK